MVSLLVKYYFENIATCDLDPDGVPCKYSTKAISDFLRSRGAKREKNNIQFHVSMSHERTGHKIWVFLYDSDGKHESESKGRDVTQNANDVKRCIRIPKQLIEQFIDTL